MAKSMRKRERMISNGVVGIDVSYHHTVFRSLKTSQELGPTVAPLRANLGNPCHELANGTQPIRVAAFVTRRLHH